jgi:L-threonylcarbamoyladenylate synthase
VARALLTAARMPIAAPSANLFSRPSPTRASHVVDDLGGRIDLVLDGGPTTVGVESTVLDLSQGVPAILRPGAVTAEMLRDLLPNLGVAAAGGSATAMRSPGLLEKHYSPRAPLTLYEGEHALTALIGDAQAALGLGQSVGVLIPAEEEAALAPLRQSGSDRVHIIVAGSLHQPAQVAASLYAALRELDAAGVDLILARGIPGAAGLAAAIADRLRRAAAGRIVRT